MLKSFLTDDSGAITVDWVVLTAALCGLAIAVTALISAGARTPTNALNSTLSTDVVGDHVSFD